MGFNLGKFLKNAAHTAGKVVGAPEGLIVKGTEDVAKVAAKIPVVGPLFHGVLGLAIAPMELSQSILNGERIDKAFVDDFKRQLSDIKEVAPYAQAVISFVPGLGTVASMAIGAGLAIASGKPLDEVLVHAVAGAIPGGAIAAAAYDVGRTAIVNHKVGGVGTLVSAIGAAAGVDIPPVAAQALNGGINALSAMANGQKPDKALLQTALAAAPELAGRFDLSSQKGTLDAIDAVMKRGRDMIPNLSDAQRKALENALHTGLAVGHAQNIQQLQKAAVATGPAMSRLVQYGQNKVSSDAVIQAARATLNKGTGLHGFDVGVGMMHHVLTPFQLHMIRSRLSPADQHGFDVAAALHIGRVLSGPPSPSSSPAALAQAAITHGMNLSGDSHAAGYVGYGAPMSADQWVRHYAPRRYAAGQAAPPPAQKPPPPHHKPDTFQSFEQSAHDLVHSVETEADKFTRNARVFFADPDKMKLAAIAAIAIVGVMVISKK